LVFYDTIYDDFIKNRKCDGKEKSSKFKACEFCVIPLTRYPKGEYLAYAAMTTK